MVMVMVIVILTSPIDNTSHVEPTCTLIHHFLSSSDPGILTPCMVDCYDPYIWKFYVRHIIHSSIIYFIYFFVIVGLGWVGLRNFIVNTYVYRNIYLSSFLISIWDSCTECCAIVV